MYDTILRATLMGNCKAIKMVRLRVYEFNAANYRTINGLRYIANLHKNAVCCSSMATVKFGRFL